MKMCHTEAMKKIKALEEKKNRLVYIEDNFNTFSYKEGEEKVIPDYSYEKTRKDIEEIDSKMRKIKHTMALSNISTKIDDFDITISEALVLLAQLNEEYDQIESLAGKQQISRRITNNGVLEYRECAYDTKTVDTDLEKLRNKISALQIAIDRANLTTMIEI